MVQIINWVHGSLNLIRGATIGSIFSFFVSLIVIVCISLWGYVLAQGIMSNISLYERAHWRYSAGVLFVLLPAFALSLTILAAYLLIKFKRSIVSSIIAVASLVFCAIYLFVFIGGSGM